MILKIGTWNMNHWQRKNFNKEAWEFLLRNLHFDVTLVQESKPNFDVLKEDALI